MIAVEIFFKKKLLALLIFIVIYWYFGAVLQFCMPTKYIEEGFLWFYLYLSLSNSNLQSTVIASMSYSFSTCFWKVWNIFLFKGKTILDKNYLNRQDLFFYDVIIDIRIAL